MVNLQEAVHSRSWSVRFDRGRHWRARIGFVLIATERNIEEEMLRLAPAGVGMHFSRVTTEGAVNVIEKRYLEACGFEVLDIQGLNLTYDREMVRVAPDYLLEFARSIDRADADAVFISCGALRTVDVIQAIEEAIGKPAVCSNQAMLWHCLRLAGIADCIPGFGRLMAL